jgi:hypothetical protein
MIYSEAKIVMVLSKKLFIDEGKCRYLWLKFIDLCPIVTIYAIRQLTMKTSNALYSVAVTIDELLK